MGVQGPRHLGHPLLLSQVYEQEAESKTKQMVALVNHSASPGSVILPSSSSLHKWLQQWQVLGQAKAMTSIWVSHVGAEVILAAFRGMLAESWLVSQYKFV